MDAYRMGEPMDATDARAGRIARRVDALSRVARDGQAHEDAWGVANAGLGARGAIYGVAYAWDERAQTYNTTRERYNVREPMSYGRAQPIARYLYPAPIAQDVRTLHMSGDTRSMRDTARWMRVHVSDAIAASFLRSDATARDKREDLMRRRARALHAEHGIGAASCEDASYHTQTEPARIGQGARNDLIPHAPSYHRTDDERCARCVYGLDAPHATTLTETTRALLARANTLSTSNTRAEHAREREAWKRSTDARIALREYSHITESDLREDWNA